MAGNTINFELRLNSNIKNETQDAKALNKELDRATGKRGTSASARQQTVEYGRARGSMEATGASGRDFANQAQGLGGLVRLYATYAANVFALSAAFQSLSAAMDTQNMIRGMAQLGATSGQSLGAISKQFAAATQGALSMREAMESTTRAVSSGLSGEQTLQIAEIATKASQALGVNLTDAVSRLTRGITKFEPELLDELGIFVRLDTAVEKYALQLGKASSALTENERLQAFANATLEQGRKKFGEIELDINPYTKFLAVLKDISFAVLSVVNTAIGPLVKLLSENPVILAGAIGLLAKNLLGNVIPVIKDYNKQLTNSTKVAQDNFKKQAAAAKAARDVQIKAINEQKQRKIEALETTEYTRLEALERQQKTFETAFDKPRLQRGVRDILIKDIQDITERELKYLDKLGTRTKLYSDIADSIRKVKTFDADILKITEQTNKELQKRPGFFTAAGQAQYKANIAAAKAGILQTVKATGETADVGGLGAAFKNIGKTVREQNLGTVGSVLAGIAGGATVAAKGVGLLFSAFTRLLLPLGVLYTLYEILSGIFVDNEKEVAAYEQKLEQLTETTKTAADAAKKYKDNISIQGLVAQTTALESSNTALKQTVDTYEQAAQKIDIFSRAIDFSLGLFNRGQTQGFIKSAAKSITTQLDAISDPQVKQAALESLSSILNVTTATPEAVAQALQDSADISRQALVDLTRESQKALSKAAEQQKKITDPLKEIKESGNQLEKAFKELQKTFESQDKFSGYILALGKDLDVLTAAFSTQNNQIAIFNQLLTDSARIGFLPAETQRDLNTALETYKGFAAEQQKLNNLRAEEAKILKGIFESEQPVIPSGTSPDELPTSLQRYNLGVNKTLDDLYTRLRDVREEIQKTVPTGFADAVAKFREGLLKANEEVIKRITAGYTNASKQIELDFKKQIVGALPQTAETARELTKLELESIQVRRDEIVAIRSLTNAMQEQKLEQQISKLEEAIKTQAPDKATETRQQIANLRLEQRALTDPRGALAQSKAEGIPLTAATRQTILSSLGQTIELEKLLKQEDLVRITGAGKEQAAKSAENILAQEQALNQVLAENQRYRQSDLKFLSLSEGSRKSILAIQKDDEAQLQNQLSFQKALAKEQEFRAQALKAEELGLPNIARFYSDAAQQAEKEARAAFTTAEIKRESEAVAERTALNTQAEVRRLEEVAAITQRNFQFQELAAQTTLDNLNIETQRIATLESQGLISAESARQQTLALEKRRLELDTYIQELGIAKQIAQIEQKRDRDIAALGPAATSLDADKIAAEARDEIYLLNAKLAAIQALSKARQQDLNTQKMVSEREKAYAKSFEATFNSLGDAIVDFAMTGEKTFKDLFRNLVADIARFELRLQTSQLWMALRPAIMSGLGFTGKATPYQAPVVMGGPSFAKGGTFDYGIERFAKGGTFTNQIVDSPTLFKFARGTGLMGEAGPEAIMPLKRDSQGNLGVRAQQPATKVEVVVNNNSSSQATATETVDSRGNRRIEVTVGDMVSGEMVRPGSSMRETMQANYGLRPALVRR